MTADSLRFDRGASSGTVPCAHRYLTSHGRGWECFDCGVGILSIAAPIPMPLVVDALKLIAGIPRSARHSADTNGPDQMKRNPNAI